MYKKSLVLVWNNYRSDVQLLERFASGTRLSNWEIPWNHPYITALWYWGFQREPQFGPIMWRSTSLSGSTVIFFQSENISTIIRCATHREMSVCLMTSWTGHVTIKNCQSAWDQHFCWFHGRVEVLEKYFIQFNLTRARNSFLCVRVECNR